MCSEQIETYSTRSIAYKSTWIIPCYPKIITVQIMLIRKYVWH